MAKSAAAPVVDRDSDDDVAEARLYECTVLYPYPLSQKEEKDTIDEVERILKDASAKIVEKDMWGRRGLAYTIGGYNEGSFAVYYCEMDPSKLKEVDTSLRIAKGILRHIIVKPPKGFMIVKYSQAFEDWQKSRVAAEVAKEREKEEELKRKVVARAKRQVKKVETEKREQAAPDAAVQEKEFTQKLEKLISDDDLEL